MHNVNVSTLVLKMYVLTGEYIPLHFINWTLAITHTEIGCQNLVKFIYIFIYADLCLAKNAISHQKFMHVFN